MELCPCNFIEEGLIEDCTECPYVAVEGETDTYKLKED